MYTIKLVWILSLSVFLSLTLWFSNSGICDYHLNVNNELNRIKRYESTEDFENFDNETGTPDGCYIVPNYVHFIRFHKPEFSFIELVCVLAAFKHQRPERIYFHTDIPAFTGKYWEYLISEKGLKDILFIEYMTVPQQIYGQPLSKPWIYFHGGDIARLRVLMKYGGIFLDNDSYIVRNLDDFRRFEMSLGWNFKGNISNQVIIAHKNARFLKEWIKSYKGHYDAQLWFYNAGIRPTQEVLLKRPELIHRVTSLLAEYPSAEIIYIKKNDVWKHHYAFHLLINHQYMLKKMKVGPDAAYPVVFDENNIKKFPVNLRDMVNAVYPLNL